MRQIPSRRNGRTGQEHASYRTLRRRLEDACDRLTRQDRTADCRRVYWDWYAWEAKAPRHWSGQTADERWARDER